MSTSPAPQHAHAAMHCNLNTVNLPAAEAFYRVVAGREPRFRSVGTDQDASAMGLGERTSSVTAFVWDERGPRAAPALELVGWSDPATVPADDHPRAGFTTIGYRVRDLVAARPALEALGASLTRASVRGHSLPALQLVDPDGVRVEVVEIADVSAPTAHGSDGSGPALAYERLRVTDLGRSLDWYATIGFAVLHRDGVSASITLPEDPTFSLELEEHSELAPSPDRANEQGLYRIALGVEDVVEAATALRAAEPTTPDPVFIPMVDTPTGGFTVLFLTDPDGTVIELVARPRSEVRRPQQPV
ncbi:hypothetical protein JNB_10509 [Janibacter sp. HTCC2649]|uniref:VOC family protein n=1 Tax=Janibacter sp. HTCC2649 TaxID=313589 RepID=UPI0000670964|nr:VOC family protein [Janibacter sp. HTCC2649]EAQ00599.1 hypothetical protein JNB_10509 [Janibacter sp. HTCC2649]